MFLTPDQVPFFGGTYFPNASRYGLPGFGELLARVRKFYDDIAIPADSFARAVVFAMSQPDDVDVNEILFRPTRQEF